MWGLVCALTELTALPNEARPAGAVAADVVAVGAILAAAHLSTLGTVETRRTTCGGGGGESTAFPVNFRLLQRQRS